MSPYWCMHGNKDNGNIKCSQRIAGHEKQNTYVYSYKKLWNVLSTWINNYSMFYVHMKQYFTGHIYVMQYSQPMPGTVLVIPPRLPRPKAGGLGPPPPKLDRKPNPGNCKLISCCKYKRISHISRLKDEYSNLLIPQMLVNLIYTTQEQYISVME